MLIIALVLALIGLVALVFAVVTSNELVAWVCIGASVLGVVLLIIDALRERQRRDVDGADHEDHGEVEAGDDENALVDYPEEVPAEGEQHPGAEDTTVDESSQGIETSEESAVPADAHGDDRTN
ncbi:hypothetical protein H7H82_21105 [Mycobacterium heidelbergense]|uniref:Uncharacterized protein n=1 Tax=Mycobacterium heidelbergense TaxID=53376 RepID=A0A1X0DU97_MYCHE|nr:hypothetical protein [Mycobacterium heidelbergense]MCV7053057.1 hypothetical protein [Mycobacterium heidelbergense]ORA75888.1 hypothetical protein BST25_02470 [Mycobacterium heidelbergense]BBZ52210.1 hypothetical protein MHEI_39270 [Mycobacterium heidelbergense]